MATASLSTFLKQLTRGMAVETLNERTDRQLVERFLARREEAAFEAIVRRHGAMVYRVCWRVLQKSQDTEDAFLGTFLLLAQKLRSVRKHDSIASWLHGVAHRVALQAKARAASRRRHEQRATMPQIERPADFSAEELLVVLDAELGKLPEKWRLPLILCYLEGRTQEDSARQVGWSMSTLRRRLEETRHALGRRLKDRGVVWSAALSAALLSDCIASASPPLGLVTSTIEAAARVAAGKTVATAASAKVAALIDGMVKAMLMTKMKTALVVIVTVLGLGTGVGLMTGISGNAVVAQEDKDKPLPTEATKLRAQELIPALGEDEFQIREKATKELKALGKEIVPQLEAALKTAESAEVRRRLEQLIAPHRPQTDLERLHGAWTLVEMETRSKKLTGKDMTYDSAPLKSLKVVIDGKNIPEHRKIPADQVTDPNDRLGGVEIQFNDSRPEKGDFRLNETKKPKVLTIALLFKYWESIYKLDGDTLTICFNPKNCIRPAEFRTAADSDGVILVFKREKPAQDKKGQGVDKQPDLSGRPVVPETKKPDLSGIQFVPETKEPDAAQKKPDEATPEVRILRGHSAAVYFAAFSPNDETLVTAAKGFTKSPRTDEVIIWDVTAQRAKHTIHFKAPPDTVPLWSMTLSDDGKTVAVGTSVGIELLDVETGKTKRTLEGPWAKSTGPFCLAFAPDGKTLAAGGSARDNIVRLWDVQTGKLTGTLKGHEDAVVGLSFSPDGKTLASTGGQFDTTIRYWEVATGQLRRRVNKAKEESKDGTEAVDGNWQSWPAAFSPDGKILARGSGAEVKFWDAQTGELKDRVIEDSHPFTRLSLAFSPDGKLVAGGRDSGEIDVWETRPADAKNDWRIGDLKQTLKEHSHPVMLLAFSSGGDLLASGDQNGKVRVWKMIRK